MNAGSFPWLPAAGVGVVREVVDQLADHETVVERCRGAAGGQDAGRATCIRLDATVTFAHSPGKGTRELAGRRGYELTYPGPDNRAAVILRR